jgi:hypothetical protein
VRPEDNSPERVHEEACPALDAGDWFSEENAMDQKRGPLSDSIEPESDHALTPQPQGRTASALL